VYTGQDPPHLAANMPITRVSELMVLPGFGAERYARIKPFLSALPVGTPINVCTAPGVVLDALSDDSRSSASTGRSRQASQGCVLPTALEDLRGALGDETYNQVKDSLANRGSYFRATVWRHYWHHPVHPVQSARPRWRGFRPPRAAQFRQRLVFRGRCLRRW